MKLTVCKTRGDETSSFDHYKSASIIQCTSVQESIFVFLLQREYSKMEKLNTFFIIKQ